MFDATLFLKDAARSHPELVFDSTIEVLWAKKYDTTEIARILNVRECAVYNRMKIMRNM